MTSSLFPIGRLVSVYEEGRLLSVSAWPRSSGTPVQRIQPQNSGVSTGKSQFYHLNKTTVDISLV